MAPVAPDIGRAEDLMPVGSQPEICFGTAQAASALLEFQHTTAAWPLGPTMIEGIDSPG